MHSIIGGGRIDLIPSQLELAFSLKSPGQKERHLPKLVNSMRDFHSEYEDHNLELAGVVFNATSDYYPEERLSKNSVIEIAGRNDWYVFENEVPYSRSFPKGAREGNPIFRTSYSRWAKVIEFSRVAQEFAERVGL